MWNEIVAKFLSIVDKVLEHFTPKQEVIKLKEKLKEYEEERYALLHELCTKKKARRIMWLNGRIYDIQEKLKNHAVD